MMTREEIIEILEEKMYVKAISTGVDSWDRHIIEHRVKGHQEAAEALLQASQPKWIACSERLPEHAQPVYFIHKNQKQVIAGVFYEAHEDWYATFNSLSRAVNHTVGDVEFWMPRFLPKPPQ